MPGEMRIGGGLERKGGGGEEEGKGEESRRGRTRGMRMRTRTREVLKLAMTRISVSFDFTYGGKSTKGMPREGRTEDFVGSKPAVNRDHKVRKTRSRPRMMMMMMMMMMRRRRRRKLGGSIDDLSRKENMRIL